MRNRTVCAAMATWATNAGEVYLFLSRICLSHSLSYLSFTLPLSHTPTRSLAHTHSHSLTQGARQKAVMDRVARLMRNRTSCAAMAT